MNPQQRKYFVILVHHGRPKVTDQSITALVSASQRPAHLVVIDHGATSYQSAQTMNLTVIRPARNSGYAGGINVGLGVLYSHGIERHDIVICMNNDVQVYPDTVANLASWWQENPAPAVVGSTMVEPQGTITSLSYVNILTGRTILYHNSLKQAPGLPQKRSLTATFKLPYIHGAFFAAPYHVFLATKGLPEKYFMYWEDAAFSQLARRAGFPLYILKNVRTKHTNKKTPTATQLYYLVRNGAIFMEQESHRTARAYWLAANRLRLVYHQLIGSQPIIRRALRDAITGKNGQKASSE